MDLQKNNNAGAPVQTPVGAQNPDEVTKKDRALILTILVILLVIAALAIGIEKSPTQGPPAVSYFNSRW